MNLTDLVSWIIWNFGIFGKSKFESPVISSNSILFTPFRCHLMTSWSKIEDESYYESSMAPSNISKIGKNKNCEKNTFLILYLINNAFKYFQFIYFGDWTNESQHLFQRVYFSIPMFNKDRHLTNTTYRNGNALMCPIQHWSAYCVVKNKRKIFCDSLLVPLVCFTTPLATFYCTRLSSALIGWRCGATI